MTVFVELAEPHFVVVVVVDVVLAAVAVELVAALVVEVAVLLEVVGLGVVGLGTRQKEVELVPQFVTAEVLVLSLFLT